MWNHRRRSTSPQSQTSVIIPTFNEAEIIESTITKVVSGARFSLQVLVSDGNSTDGTQGVARRAGARVLPVGGGRAAQLNAAARCATGDILLFLHADTKLPHGYDVEMRRVLSAPVIAGAFRLGIDSNMFGIQIVRRVANWRAAFLQRPYGDQGLFLTRETFEEIGGYPDMPFLDDYEIVRRLARRGRIGLARTHVVTSGRRWEALGVVRTTLMNQAVIAAYHLGCPVEKLRDWYRNTLIRGSNNRLTNVSR